MNNKLTPDHSPLAVQEEPAERVLDETLALLNLTRPNRDARSVDFLRWKYLENPDGEAVIWTVRSQPEGKLVGFTACMPRRMLVRGSEHLAWVGADFSIHPEFRTLGPAVKLRRQASQAIEAGRASFLFAHPNEKMAAIHARCGHVPLGAMIQLARPLQLASRLAQRKGGVFLKHVAGAVIDPLIRGAMRLWTPRLRSIEKLRGSVFDDRFDQLFKTHAQAFPVMGIRDARYLNWRWSRRSGEKPRVLLDLEGGKLRGFVVFTCEHQEVRIRDLFPGHDNRVVNRLLSAVVREGLIHRVSGLRTYFLEGNPLVSLMRNRFFFDRMEPTTAYVYLPRQSPLYDDVTSCQAWFMSMADRDV